MATSAGDGPSPPQEIDGLRLFEKPRDDPMGRIVYQGRERPTFAPRSSAAHDYWIIEQDPVVTGASATLVHAIATFDRGDGFDRHQEHLVDTYPNAKRAVDDIENHLDEGVGNTVLETFDDGSIRFWPPHTKEDAEYRRPRDDRFNESHKRCGSCAHYIPGRGCHFVQGEINPRAYCLEYYADYGVFAQRHRNRMDVNAELVGRRFDWNEVSVRDFMDEVRDSLDRLREGREAGGEDLKNLLSSEKLRRLKRPRDGDEWPWTWDVFKTQATLLPSWKNADGTTIRVVENQAGEPYGFVHIGGSEDWRGLTYDELHDVIVDYMADHPGV